jgi:20S proteasome alpha/beta subunit
MTIVAGFRVKDGVVLCSDTQYTGAAKIYQKKLFHLPIGTDHYVFGLAGHEPNGKMAIDECEDALSDLKPGEHTTRRMKNVLRCAVKPVIDDYVLARPAYEREVLEFSLLVGCHAADGPSAGHKLFAVRSNGVVNNIEDYECLGTGSYLGHYLLKPSFHEFMSLDATMLLASQALRAAKDYDASCGGPSSFEVIMSNGNHETVAYDFYNTDAFLRHYEMFEAQLRFAIAPQNKDDLLLELRLKEFTDAVRGIRATWKKVDRARRNLIAVGIQPSSPTTS